MKKGVPNWNKSSAVLRNSDPKYSIPKDSRFKSPNINYYNHYQLKYPTTLGDRATTFGLGKKADIPKVFGDNK